MTAPPKVLSLLVGRDDGVVQGYYGVHHENKLWLVTAWISPLGTPAATPERMVRVDVPPAIPGAPGSQWDYENILLPKAVIEGLFQDAPGYEVRNLPSSPMVNVRDLKPLPSFPWEILP